jgi:ubiquinone/menaquinone biosynthesis C-methylase UbiE
MCKNEVKEAGTYAMDVSSSSSYDDRMANNSYFLDVESAAEMARLVQLDMVTTRQMGGPLAEQSDLSHLSHILDIACGPGGWVLSAARAFPNAEVAGIDISKTMIGYANARARSEGLTNASFEIMDITRALEFPDDIFDLVNGRLLIGVLRRAMWMPLVQECFRITRPGGVLRMTELDILAVTNSPAFNYLDSMLTKAAWKAGYGFSPDERTLCVTPMLPGLLRDAGYQEIQMKPHVIDFSAGTEVHMAFYHNSEIAFKLAQPFITGTGVANQEDLEQAYQHALCEMQRDDFRAMWYFLTVWGKKPH